MSYRKLQLKGETWLYVVGQNGVKIRSPQNKVTWVEAWKILGYENRRKYLDHIYEVSGDEDHGYTPPIAPQDIKDWIFYKTYTKKV